MPGRSIPGCLALAAASLVPACQSADIDVDDHDALFADVRVRKRFGEPTDGAMPYVEAGWTRADGGTDPLDDTIDQISLGGGATFGLQPFAVRQSCRGGMRPWDRSEHASRTAA
jgi:hypothetical protein